MKGIAYIALAAALVGCGKKSEEAIQTGQLPEISLPAAQPVIQFTHQDIASLLNQGVSPSDMVANNNVTYADLSAFVRDAYRADNLGSGYGRKVKGNEWQMIIDEAQLGLKVLGDSAVKPKLDKTAGTLESDFYLQIARGQSRLMNSQSDYDSVYRNLFEAILHADNDALRGGLDTKTISESLLMIDTLSYKPGTTKSFQRVFGSYDQHSQDKLNSHLQTLSGKARNNYKL